jgi:hypothetical protein
MELYIGVWGLALNKQNAKWLSLCPACQYCIALVGDYLEYAAGKYYQKQQEALQKTLNIGHCPFERFVSKSQRHSR